MVNGQSNKWLDAQADIAAALKTLPACLCMSDLKNDDYYKLIAAEIPLDMVSKSKLKVYKGTSLISEQGLPGIPSAVESLYSDENDLKTPIIAVAIGPSVLFYRNMKPYYKYTLPSMTIEPLEMEVWRKLNFEKPENFNELIKELKTLEISQLTQMSQKLIHLPETSIHEYLKENCDVPLKRLSVITALTTMQKTNNEAKSVSCLVIATESGEILILDSYSFTVLHRSKVCSFKGTPSIISASGQFDIDFRIVVATREGSICLLRKSWLEGRQIVKIENPATGLVILPIDQTIVVVCMNNLLMCYSKKGKKLWSVTLPGPSVCMAPVVLAHLGITLVCVALRGGLVQLYSQKNLVDQFTAPDTISAMTFGRLGQEEHVLVLVTVDGSLIVKILKRTADFSSNSILGKSNSTIDSVESLQIPKKTKIFVEQTNRERENARSIHESFQTELWRLRLTAARATVDTINSAESTISGDIGQAPIKLAAEIQGLGPVFRLKIILENMATRKEAMGLSVLLHADHRHYFLEKPYTKLPSLTPSSPLKLDFKVTVILDKNDGLPPSDLTPETAIIRVMIIKSGQAKPLIAATVAMPTPEPILLETY